jgi:predicted translin family RNA/ssDNA-binding protein
MAKSGKARDEEIRAAEELAKEAGDVANLLHDSWTALVRCRKNFIKSAIKAGMAPGKAQEVYQGTLAEAQKEYTEAFKRAWELKDEHTALLLNVPAPKRGKG